jgi:hypothetical protein
VVSDEVGQIYIFGTGSKMSEKDVKYDQVGAINLRNILYAEPPCRVVF